VVFMASNTAVFTTVILLTTLLLIEKHIYPKGINEASISLIQEKEKQKVETSKSSRQCAPSLLIVDDNKINLKLLSTYLKKKEYDIIDEAENGAEAVAKVREKKVGYDIIFMDISMPVLDGFGATRQIRAIEKERRNIARHVAESEITSPALVIALTGLASSRDRAEALISGIDLFLTKPIAFREVGKLLQDWEDSREQDDIKLSK
jgi:CheY-like chemotaxis protein